MIVVLTYTERLITNRTHSIIFGIAKVTAHILTVLTVNILLIGRAIVTATQAMLTLSRAVILFFIGTFFNYHGRDLLCFSVISIS